MIKNNISIYPENDGYPPWIDEKIKKMFFMKIVVISKHVEKLQLRNLTKIHVYLINYEIVKQVQSLTGQY